jgi:hypothetical protein
MSPTFSAANRNASFARLPESGDRASLLPTTPTLRLLEIVCGLPNDRSQPAHTAPDRPSTRAPFPDRPSALTATQAFGVVTCGLLLSAIVAALIISLG